MTAPRSILTLLIAMATIDGSQQVPTYTLTRPIASPTTEFTELTALFELANGQLLVGDQSERKLLLLDPETSRTKPAARSGSGPTEWKTVSTLLRRPDRGAYLVDFAQRRLLPFDSTGRVAGAISMPLTQIQFRWIDARGRVYGTVMGPRAMGSRTLPDSSTIVRWDLTTKRVDSLVEFNAGNSRHITMPGDKLKVFPAIDGWTVLANGDVVVLEAATYRVVTYRDGKPTNSARIAWDPVQVSSAERQAFIEAQENAHLQMMGQPGKSSSPQKPAMPGYEFPATKPAFDNLMDDAIHISPANQIWVARAGSANQPLSYDVLNASGSRVAQVVLPKGAALAGFGTSAVYLAERDENDVIRLRKYADPVKQ